MKRHIMDYQGLCLKQYGAQRLSLLQVIPQSEFLFISSFFTHMLCAVVMGIRLFLVSRIIWLGSPRRDGSFGSQTALQFTTYYTFYNLIKCSPVLTNDLYTYINKIIQYILRNEVFKSKHYIFNINDLLWPIVFIAFIDPCNSLIPPNECTDLLVEPRYIKQIATPIKTLA